MLPEVLIDRKKLADNVQLVKRMLDTQDIELVGVTKVFCGDPVIAKVLIENGVAVLADSRISNLKKLSDFPVRRMLLRLPAFSEIHDVVKYSDISLVSHFETVKKISECAVRQKRNYNVILMLDLGDLREGVFDEAEFFSIARKIMKLPNIILEGIGTNLCCFGAILPSSENLAKLIRVTRTLESTLNVSFSTLSGGNSCCLHLLADGALPGVITQLRIGEAIVLGRETAYGVQLEGSHDDCFILRAEIIEIHKKPSQPIGDVGRSAYGEIPTFIDRGQRLRAICAIGRQDVDVDHLRPLDRWISVVGASGDHLVLDIEEVGNRYSLGDVVGFKLNYGALLRVMNSDYVAKSYQ